MARALLILPHLPQRMGGPYLGQMYVAASLLRAGHEVRCLDLAAIAFEGDDQDAVDLARAYAPDLIGMTLFTLNAARGYRLAAALRDTTRLLVAGGAHPTVRPHEPLAHGFDVSVSGEGEHAIVAIADALDRGADLADLAAIPAVHVPSGDGPAGGFITDLDALAWPAASLDCYDPAQYGPRAHLVQGGMMTSRGCPARCTFCANYVTGRGYRYRSNADIVAEMVHLRERHGVASFAFYDDAFTAQRPRLNTLCDAIVAEPDLAGAAWTCITPANMVKPRDLAKMRASGCLAVNFGIESGDAGVLKTIQKGQRPEQVIEAVRAAKSEGLMTIVNFMFGFPGEGVAQLRRTQDLMETLAEHTDFFNNRGVLVPFPGTPVYERHHAAFGFTDWWLDPAMIPDEPNIHVLDPTASQRYLEHDPSLDLDFFHYAPDVRAAIADCVRFKAQHNQRVLARKGDAEAAA